MHHLGISRHSQSMKAIMSLIEFQNCIVGMLLACPISTILAISHQRYEYTAKILDVSCVDMLHQQLVG